MVVPKMVQLTTEQRGFITLTHGLAVVHNAAVDKYILLFKSVQMISQNSIAELLW